MAEQSPLPLASPDRIRAIATASIEAVRAIFEDDHGDTPIGVLRARLNLAACGLRFCAVAAGQLGRPELIDVLIAGVSAFPHFDRVEAVAVNDLAFGISALLRCGAPVTTDVVRLARHRDERIRGGIAKGLTAGSEAEIALLQELAADPSPAVRCAARRPLGSRLELPWWLGKWSRDPSTMLTPDEHREHAGALRRIAAILDGERWEIAAGWAEVTSLAGMLPDAPAVDLAEMLLRTHEASGFRDAAIPALLVARPGGGDALLRLLRRWDGDTSSAYHGEPKMRAALAAVPHARRAPIVRELVSLALTAAPKQRSAPFSAARMAAEIAGETWPPGEDTEPVLDGLLALEPVERGFDRVKHDLASILRHPPRDATRMHARALAARRAGYEGGFAALRGALDELLAALGEGAEDEKGL